MSYDILEADDAEEFDDVVKRMFMFKKEVSSV